ncbi:type II toxin-antitoxin system ParD family antitoxin [Mesorhizobium xinjiangense]|uniref:type II toxin-antitoxin system ParD family antitoxin n=1 Tax=Mesorhizobium xinjiangense TaxID=2678685 RepID=UPI001F3B3875|nr:type II toxin-antitoxin system ParD family antitoxin [Mesorhizobium xinjiangense]
MVTMNVSLTKDIAEFVNGEVATGDYVSASEVVRDALRLLKRDRDLEDERAAMLRAAVDIGLTQANRREFSQRTVEQIAEDVLSDAE